MLKCSQLSPVMPLYHICKAIHFLSPVLFIPSLSYALFNSENFHLLVTNIFQQIKKCNNRAQRKMPSGLMAYQQKCYVLGTEGKWKPFNAAIKYAGDKRLNTTRIYNNQSHFTYFIRQ